MKFNGRIDRQWQQIIQMEKRRKKRFVYFEISVCVFFYWKRTHNANNRTLRFDCLTECLHPLARPFCTVDLQCRTTCIFNVQDFHYTRAHRNISIELNDNKIILALIFRHQNENDSRRIKRMAMDFFLQFRHWNGPIIFTIMINEAEVSEITDFSHLKTHKMLCNQPATLILGCKI